jgi:hypothetical protein
MRFYYRREENTQKDSTVERKSFLDKILEETSSSYPTSNSDMTHAPVAIPVEVNRGRVAMKFVSTRRVAQKSQVTPGVDLTKVKQLAQEILEELSKESPQEALHSLANELVQEINPPGASSTGVSNPLASGTKPIEQATDTFMFNLSQHSQRKVS